MIKFYLLQKEVGTNRDMKEDYEKDLKESEVEQWCKDTIEYFNSTLRPHEKAREYIGFEIIKQDQKREHRWVKQNLVTVVKGRSMYDEHQCELCGITAKRHGLSPEFVRDRPWKAKKYIYCELKLK